MTQKLVTMTSLGPTVNNLYSYLFTLTTTVELFNMFQVPCHCMLSHVRRQYWRGCSKNFGRLLWGFLRKQWFFHQWQTRV